MTVEEPIILGDHQQNIIATLFLEEPGYSVRLIRPVGENSDEPEEFWLSGNEFNQLIEYLKKKKIL